MQLTFRPRPMPPADALGDLLVAQLGPLLPMALGDGPDGLGLIDRFDVLDAAGAHVYDLALFCGDDGQVFWAGTLDHVASFSQGGATGTDDAEILAALDAAYDDFYRK